MTLIAKGKRLSCLNSGSLSVSTLTKRKTFVNLHKKEEIVANLPPTPVQKDEEISQEEDTFSLPDKIPDYINFLHENEQQDDEKSVLPQVLSLMASRQFSSSSLVLKNLDEKKTIPEISDPNFERIFMKKVEVCKDIYDFTATDPISIKLRDEKTDFLREISDFMSKNENTELLPPKLQNELWNMLYLNIFDQDPKFPSKIESASYTVTIVDPMWPHLVYAFSILTRYTSVFFNSEVFSEQIIKKAVYLTNLPDPNVRFQLLVFLRLFLEKRLDMFHVVLKAAADQLNNILCGIVPPYCATPLLQLFITLYNKSNMRPPQSFNNAIRQIVLPLLGSPYFPGFSSQFNALIVTLLQLPKRNSSLIPTLKSFGTKISIGSCDSAKGSQSKTKNSGSFKIGNPLLGGKRSASPSAMISYKTKITASVSVPQEVTPNLYIQRSSTSRITCNDIFTAIDKFWPRTNATRQLYILDTIFIILEVMGRTIPYVIVQRICKFLSGLLTSDNVRLQEKILSILIPQGNATSLFSSPDTLSSTGGKLQSSPAQNHSSPMQNWVKIYSKVISDAFYPQLLKMMNDPKTRASRERIQLAINEMTSNIRLPSRQSMSTIPQISPRSSEYERENEWIYLSHCAIDNHMELNAHAFKKMLQNTDACDPTHSHFFPSLSTNQMCGYI